MQPMSAGKRFEALTCCLLQRPRRRLRNLQSVRVKCEKSQPHRADTACFLALWTHVRDKDSDHLEATCIHVSNQVSNLWSLYHAGCQKYTQ